MLRKMSVGSLVAALSLASIVACSESIGPDPDDVAGVLIFTTQNTVLVGQTLQLSGRAVTYALVRVDDRVTWRSSNTAIATVSSTGLVTGVAAGGVSIIATAGDFSDDVLINVTSGIDQ